MHASSLTKNKKGIDFYLDFCYIFT